MPNCDVFFTYSLKNLALDVNEGDKTPITEITGNEKTNTETEDKEGNRVIIQAGFKVTNPECAVDEGIVI